MPTTQHKTPTLRFKDEQGKDYPNWDEERLGAITKIYDGTHQTPRYVKEGVPFYSVEHVTADQFDNTKFISEKSFEQEKARVILEKGDILMTRIGSVGVAKFIDWDVRASFYVSLALIKKPTKSNSQYLAQYINNRLFQRELWKRTIHVAFPKKINLGEIGNCLVQFPCNEEQQKIAAFLSSVDTKIEQLNKKKSLLEQYKQGMMQKLFGQEIRFKGERGEEYPDWEKKSLGCVGEITGGGTPDTNKQNLWNGDILWFTPTEIKSKYSGNSIRKISKEGLAKSSATLLPVGTILFTSRATIGEASIARKECTTNQGFQSFIVNDLLFSNEYIYYWIIKNKKQFLRRANGSTFLEISKGEMKKISFSAPDIKEQQKIASFLSMIDKKIELVTEQIKQAQTFKKGLLQQMFV